MVSGAMAGLRDTELESEDVFSEDRGELVLVEFARGELGGVLLCESLGPGLLGAASADTHLHFILGGERRGVGILNYTACKNVVMFILGGGGREGGEGGGGEEAF